MSKKIKIYHSACQNGYSSYSSWIRNRQIVPTLEEADVLFINGGTDWSPELYGQKTHSSNWGYSPRDHEEMRDMKKAVKMGKYIVGTCRGLN